MCAKLHPWMCAALIVALGALAPRLLAAENQPGSGIHPYPLWPSQPVPGWPGLNADENTTEEKLTQRDAATGEVTTPAKSGQPEFLAYPGAVHHERGSLQRYVPPYPILNQRTLVSNFILKDLPAYQAACVEFAEPVYYNAIYGNRVPTTQRRPAVKAFPWRPGSAPIQLELGRLKPSFYVLRTICAAPGVATVQPKKLVSIQLRINDLPNDREKPNAYILNGQTLDNFYPIADFFFHVEDDRAFHAELTLMSESPVELLLYNADLHDRFGELARRAGLRTATITEARAQRAKELQEQAKAPSARRRSPEEQKAFDDFVWQTFPPVNCYFETAVNYSVAFKDLVCRAPEEWARFAEPPIEPGAPLLLRCKDGKLYGDQSEVAYADPPEYEFKGGTVVSRDVDLGPYSAEFVVKGGAAGQVFKGDKVVCEDARNAWCRDAELYQNGKFVRKVAKISALAMGRKCFDAEGHSILDSIADLGPAAEGKLYYLANDVYHRTYRPSLPMKTEQEKRDSAFWLVRAAYERPYMSRRMMRGVITNAQEGLDREEFGIFHSRAGFVFSMLDAYEKLLPFICDNQELAAAVSRYLPRIKAPQDVIALLDTHLLQDHANEIMNFRFYYDTGEAPFMTRVVTQQDDPDITRPWMEWLWTRTWMYPQAMAGLPDYLVTGTMRDGGTIRGSWAYEHGGNQLSTAMMVEKYIQRGGDRKYDLTDFSRYPAILREAYFDLDVATAHRHVPMIGDVGGPTRPNGIGMSELQATTGWRWTKDPKFAWELVNVLGRKDQTDAEWAEIVKAAEGRRDPFLENKSRILSDWHAVLEGGQDEDDFRFRRALAVRVGNGYGHHHLDTMDLSLWAHGIVMSGDAGQRPEYGIPKHRRSFVHNVMEVDGQDWYSYAWAGNLFDAPGAHYLRTASVAPFGMENVTLFQRQTALVDADEGRRSNAPEPRKDADVITPSSYVFDVFRGAGGKTYTYCFHGQSDDQFQVNIKNRRDMTGAANNPDEDYLRPFSYRQVQGAQPDDVEWAADAADAVLQATWRVGRWANQGNNPEAKMYAGDKFGGAMTDPRKFMRLHLFDAADLRVLHGICQDTVRWNEHNPGMKNYAARCLFGQRRSPTPMETVFVALLEPYAGEPFIAERRQLAVQDNETDARRAVAVEVKTRNGHTDWLFADGRPEKTRQLDGGVSFAAEYAYVSRDAEGLRQAVVSHGTLLKTPELTLTVETPRYGGKVVALDYLQRRATVAGKLPAHLAGQWCEAGGTYHRTSYGLTAAEPGAANSVAVLDKGLEIMRTRVLRVEPQTNTVVGAVAMIRVRGRDRDLVASNDAMTKFWRVAYVGGERHSGHLFQLSPMDPQAQGPVFTEADFPLGSGLSVWEFGVGDELTVKTGVSFRRAPEHVGKDLYEVVATSPFTLSLGVKGKALELSHDLKKWSPAGIREGQRLVLKATEEMLAQGRFYLRAIE